MTILLKFGHNGDVMPANHLIKEEVALIHLHFMYNGQEPTNPQTFVSSAVEELKTQPPSVVINSGQSAGLQFCAHQRSLALCLHLK